MTTPPPIHDDLADTTALPESVRAEAAVWLARLHSDQRSEQTERDFRAWLASDALHAAAFERMTNTWEATAILRESRETRSSSSTPRPQ